MYQRNFDFVRTGLTNTTVAYRWLASLVLLVAVLIAPGPGVAEAQDIDEGSTIGLEGWVLTRIETGTIDNGEDITPPISSPTFSPLANDAGWYNADVTITWNWIDAAGRDGEVPSGIDPANCELSSQLAGEGFFATVGQCSDLAGNGGLQGSGSINIDWTAPETTITSNPSTTNTTGNVVFEFTGSDAVSGVAGFECALAGDLVGEIGPCNSPQQYSGLADGNYAFSVRAIDAADNADQTVASFSFTVDTTPPDTTAPTADPSFAPMANAAGWHNTDVTVNFNWRDPAGPNGETPSGIDENNCITSRDVVIEGSSVGFGGDCVDLVGNIGDYVGSVSIDKTAPDTTIILAPRPDSIISNAYFEFSGSDSLSGLAGFTCTVGDGTISESGPCTNPHAVTGLENGTYNFSVQAIDVAGNVDATPATYTWTIDANVAPVLGQIGNKTVTAGQLLQFNVTATDVNNDSVSFSLSNAPTGASLVDNGDGTATFSWTPTTDQMGNHTDVLFSVTDDGQLRLTANETITISVDSTNRPPQFNPTANQTTNEGEQLVFAVQAIDVDSDQIALAMANEPTGAAFVDNGNGSGMLTWTPTSGQSGNHTIMFIATDDGTPAQTDTLDVLITVGDVNRPPVLDMIGTRTGNAGEMLSFLVTATDPGGHSPSFRLANAPQGATLTDNYNGTATFEWMPGDDQTGNAADVLFTVTSFGPQPQFDTESVMLSIGNVNRPPVLNPIGNRTVQEGELLAFTLTSVDADGHDVNFAQPVDLPIGATLVDNNDGTATFGWTPGFDQTGNFTTSFVINDEVDDGSESDMEVITISVGNVNRAPVLQPIGHHVVELGSILSISFRASDPDGDSLSFLAPAGLPTNANFFINNDGSATINWIPTADQIGLAMVTVQVNDNGSPIESAAEVFSISVVPLPDTDSDGIADFFDNCTNVANSSQTDTDGDGYGNACDADFNNDCVVNFIDLGLMRQVFFTNDVDKDLNGDGVVNATDLGIFRGLFFRPPGPSSLSNNCAGM